MTDWAIGLVTVSSEESPSACKVRYGPTMWWLATAGTSSPFFARLASEAEAHRIAARLQERHVVRHSGSNGSPLVTLSIGIASF